MRLFPYINKHRPWLVALIPATMLFLAYLFCLPRELFHDNYSRILYSRDSTLMGARVAADGQWRFPVADEQVPEKYAKAVIAFEDKRFYSHWGVDPLAIGRAIRQNLQRGEVVSGASTLTMQTIRLSRSPKTRSIGQKIIEMILATRLELRCSKKEILRLYSAHAPFGGNVVGLEAACHRYFQRQPSQLSWAEAALLAVLPNNPSWLYLGKNQDLLETKRNRLLQRLYINGDMDSLDCVLAQEEPLPQSPYPMPDLAYHLLERAGEEHGNHAFYSTLDAALQERVNTTALRYHSHYKGNGVNNLAILIADVSTGTILAYYGNIFQPNAPVKGGSVDIIRSPRSSGSTLKPFLYAAMLDKGMIWPGQLVKDTPFHAKNFAPKNFNNTYEGAAPANEVIRRSLNVPSVRLLDAYGVEAFKLLLQNSGFTTLFRQADDYGLSLILGGAEITLDDAVTAYYRLAAQLRHSADPSQKTYSKLSYLKSESSLETERKTQTKAPLSDGAAFLMAEVLSQLNRPEEEASWEVFQGKEKIAWKTGTSWGHRDAWSIGFTPNYVVGVWVGNASGEGRAQLTGVGYAAPVLFDVFSLLPRKSDWFELPEARMKKVAACHLSGHPATDLCTQVDTIWVPLSDEAPEACPYHILVHLDAREQFQVNSSCYSVQNMVHKSWFVLPPAQEWYYMKKHLNYKALPPLHPDLQQGISAKEGIEIIYPQAGDVIITPRDLDGQRKGALLRAAHRDPDAILYWHLDNQYLGMTRQGQHQIQVDPATGRHTLYVTDSYGVGASVNFTVSNL